MKPNPKPSALVMSALLTARPETQGEFLQTRQSLKGWIQQQAG